MRIDVGQLLKEPIGAQADIDVNLGPQRLAEDVEVTSAQGTLSLWRTTEGIWIRGSLAVGIDLQCVRCLAPVTHTLDVELDEQFTLSPEDVEHEGVYLVDADHHINLTPAMRELVIVSTPMRILCSAGCEGLCPECGKNLNAGSCDCETDDIDPRMAALKALLT
jgi:uncharacterized metal-binding protein YceD (DUF177 family)